MADEVDPPSACLSRLDAKLTRRLELESAMRAGFIELAGAKLTLDGGRRGALALLVASWPGPSAEDHVLRVVESKDSSASETKRAQYDWRTSDAEDDEVSARAWSETARKWTGGATVPPSLGRARAEFLRALNLALEICNEGP